MRCVSRVGGVVRPLLSLRTAVSPVPVVVVRASASGVSSGVGVGVGVARVMVARSFTTAMMISSPLARTPLVSSSSSSLVAPPRALPPHRASSTDAATGAVPRDAHVYWGSGSQPAWKVLLGLKFKAIPYKSHLLSFAKAEHHSAEMKAMNPRGKVPVYRDADVTMYESNAIVLYLELTYPGKRALLPLDKVDRAKVLVRFHEVNYIEEAMLDVSRYLRGGTAQADYATVLQRKVAALATQFDYFERYLNETRDQQWIAGTLAPSLADVAFIPWVAMAVRSGATLNKWPSLKAYYQRVSVLPEFKETSPPHWIEGPGPNFYAAL